MWVEDATGGRLAGCVRHSASLLATLDGGRVYPNALAGAAVEVYNLAKDRRPYDFS